MANSTGSGKVVSKREIESERGFKAKKRKKRKKNQMLIKGGPKAEGDRELVLIEIISIKSLSAPPIKQGLSGFLVYRSWKIL